LQKNLEVIEKLLIYTAEASGCLSLNMVQMADGSLFGRGFNGGGEKISYKYITIYIIYILYI
jgi:hypothetical protein